MDDRVVRARRLFEQDDTLVVVGFESGHTLTRDEAYPLLARIRHDLANRVAGFHRDRGPAPASNEHDCDGCSPSLPGIFYPVAPDGDESRAWVERCDNCGRFECDDDAAVFLGWLFGVEPRWSVSRGRFYIPGFVFGDMPSDSPAMDMPAVRS